MYTCVLVVSYIIHSLFSQKEETALHIASRHGYLSIVNLLIEAKAGINLQNKVCIGNKCIRYSAL